MSCDDSLPREKGRNIRCCFGFRPVLKCPHELFGLDQQHLPMVRGDSGQAVRPSPDDSGGQPHSIASIAPQPSGNMNVTTLSKGTKLLLILSLSLSATLSCSSQSQKADSPKPKQKNEFYQQTVKIRQQNPDDPTDEKGVIIEKKVASIVADTRGMTVNKIKVKDLKELKKILSQVVNPIITIATHKCLDGAEAKDILALAQSSTDTPIAFSTFGEFDDEQCR